MEAFSKISFCKSGHLTIWKFWKVHVPSFPILEIQISIIEQLEKGLLKNGNLEIGNGKFENPKTQSYLILCAAN